MRTSESNISGDDEKDSRVLIWDAPTRAFHWAAVALIVTSWYSADQGLMSVHLLSGAALAVLLLFRLTWGIVGSTTARFSDFVAPPRSAVRYLKSLSSSNQVLYAGHNPAGGWMVIGFLLVLGFQVITGFFANDDARFHAPFSLLVSKDLSDQLTMLHGWGFYAILLMIWLHLVAVFFYWLVKGENLIAPMFTGRKHAKHVPAGLRLTFVRSALALLIMAIGAAIVGWLAYF